MAELTEEGRERIDGIAARHGVSPATAEGLFGALQRGGGTQAQFDAPELGGMGQWSRGGMIMIGDMFNSALKARVDALCTELAGLIGAPGLFRPTEAGDVGPGGWPAWLGAASSSGGQNDMRYAVFPGTRRLAVAHGGTVTIYDTGDHAIGGVSQAQSGGQSLTFTSQFGPVRLDELAVIGADGRPGPAKAAAEALAVVPPVAAPEPIAPVPTATVPTAAAPAATAPAASAPAAPRAAGAGAAAPAAAGDPVGLIERLAELHARGILTDEEFSRKKAELLDRL
ncbi:MAG: SHOCT domain-containing protein [Amaricoccus sp.]|uniref:SHOCT domain-containing protein n=1 Tax=Amaricoccus sp. TaxID=1872485 RepID=UPI0039E3E6A4